jgi:demethylspheroidene O-methyltransferase
MTLEAEADVTPPRQVRGTDLRTRLARLAAKPWFQHWAARLPGLRGKTRSEGAALFDLVQGFVASQALRAVVELRLLHRLMDGPQAPEGLGAQTGVPANRMALLCQAASALGLMRRLKDGRFGITTRGAALLGVPGLESMIAHHDVLYRDMADPVALLRGEVETELAQFWPYVFGAAAAEDPTTAHRYSKLMADSQALVANDALAAAPLKGVARLMDVGGGSGAFAEAAARATPGLQVTLFDLPPVVEAARQRLSGSDVADRIGVHGGSFRDDDLPHGHDAISLIRVLYDHQDDTVRGLLARVHAALPPGGRLLVAEPMSGGATPERAGDVYFAFYCLAMGTGTVRSADRISALLSEVGFDSIAKSRPARPYVTSVVTAQRAG